MKTYNLCLLGFGNVNRALVELLRLKSAEPSQRYSIGWRVTGIASRSQGWHANPEGLLGGAGTPAREEFPSPQSLPDLHSWLQTAHPDVLFEATSLNAETGQPAIDHIRAALEYGAHVVTANKGPIVHAYRELRDVASQRGRGFLFESTVMDGVPIFSLFRSTLPAIEVKGFRGILNSTTNVILSGMEKGLSFDEALREAQRLGVAETDAAYDIDGWDAAVKVAALVNVVMDVPLSPKEVERRGIRGLSGEAVRSARAESRPYKLVCRVERAPNGARASVRPEQPHLAIQWRWSMGHPPAFNSRRIYFPGLQSRRKTLVCMQPPTACWPTSSAWSDAGRRDPEPHYDLKVVLRQSTRPGGRARSCADRKSGPQRQPTENVLCRRK